MCGGGGPRAAADLSEIPNHHYGPRNKIGTLQTYTNNTPIIGLSEAPEGVGGEGGGGCVVGIPDYRSMLCFPSWDTRGSHCLKPPLCESFVHAYILEFVHSFSGN